MSRSLFRYSLCTLAVASSLLVLADIPMNTNNKTDQGEKVITPSTNPVVQHGFDLFIAADFIYWTSRVDNIDYAETGVTHSSNISSNNPTLTNPGHTIGPHHKMSPGFKVGIGVNMGHDGWDSYVQYTWLHNSAASQDTVPSGKSTWQYAGGSLFSINTTRIQAGNSEWHLHFNDIDWELGREFFISSYLILRPHIGLKGSWQKQTYSVHQTDIIDNSQSQPGSLVFDQVGRGSYTMYQKQSYWGLGIRAGLNTAWHFTRNWSIFGDCAVAPLWSQFTVSRLDRTTESSSNRGIPVKTGLIVANQSNRLHSLRAVLELALGLRWDYWFLDDDYRIRIQAAWEEQVWFGQHEFLDAIHPTYGNLSLQGLTVGFTFDF
jgi:hypothetical protein